MKQTVLVGVDVSAQELVVALDRGTGAVWSGTFANDAAGHRKLIGVLTRRGAAVRVCVEATGIYHLELALALVAHERIELMVANPRATKDFSRARLQRTKTDHTDAVSILEFVRRMPFVVWNPPDPAIRDLQALSRRISALLVTRAQEKNRLHVEDQLSTRTQAIRESIERHMDAINAEVQALTEAAIETLHTLPFLKRRFELLVSVKGIAKASAIALLAELAVLPEDMTTRQWVAHAGLDPRHYQSGSSVRAATRISKVGNRHLRAALFMPAMVAARYEPRVKAFYEKLIARGKKPIQAIVAVMRKLLHAIHGMFRSDTVFNGTKFFAAKALAPERSI
jgi:transposase